MINKNFKETEIKSEFKYLNKINQDIHFTDLKSPKYFSLEEIVHQSQMNKILFQFFPNQATMLKDYNFNLTKSNSIQKLPNLSRYSENVFHSDKIPTFCFSFENFNKYINEDYYKASYSLIEINIENILRFIENEKKITKFLSENLNYNTLNYRIKNLYNCNLINYNTFYNFLKIYEFLDSIKIDFEKTENLGNLFYNQVEAYYKTFPKYIDTNTKESKFKNKFKLIFLL